MLDGHFLGGAWTVCTALHRMRAVPGVQTARALGDHGVISLSVKGSDEARARPAGVFSIYSVIALVASRCHMQILLVAQMQADRAPLTR
jgi:hypothetical protein